MDGKPLHVQRPHPNHTHRLWAASVCPVVGKGVRDSFAPLWGYPTAVQVCELRQFRLATLQHSKLPGSQQA